MEVPSEMYFTAINRVTVDDIKNSNFLIYAHVCSDGIYIGMSIDPVKRWQEHCSDALNKSSHNYDDKLRIAIRRHEKNFKHYIIGTAKFEKSARNKEAFAIRFYNANLNMKLETIKSASDYYFRPIEGQIGENIRLAKKGRTGTHLSRADSDRETVIGEIYTEYGRKRLRVIEGQKFPSGMNIECSRSERSRFNNGDTVRVNVALSEKSNGTKYLVAAKTSKLILMEQQKGQIQLDF